MTAEIVQFIPRPNRARPTLLETELLREPFTAADLDRALEADTSPSEYSAPDDCA